MLQGLTLRGTEALPLPGVTALAGEVDLVLSGCDFHDFEAQSDGLTGGSALRVTATGTIAMTDCRFQGNVNAGRGGAVFLGGGLTGDFNSVVWQGNTSMGHNNPRGGGLMIDGSQVASSVEFHHCHWLQNTSGGPGGGMSSLSVDALFEDCTVVGNRSAADPAVNWGEGAGLHLRRNTTDRTGYTLITARNCLFEDNGPVDPHGMYASDGGGFYMAGGGVDRMSYGLVEDCVFRENLALWGAGCYFSRWVEGTLRRSRFYNNTAFQQAGAAIKGGEDLSNDGETMIIENCLFIGNKAGYDRDGTPSGSYSVGGAVVCRMRPRMEMRHCTFINNRVAQSGWMMGDAFATHYEFGQWTPENLCIIENCVFWGTDGNHYQMYLDENGMEAVNNCAVQPGEINSGTFEPTGTVWLDEMPFAHLETGLPAPDGVLIDAGIDAGITDDLDGNLRPYGAAPDIGCFEWNDDITVPDPGPQLTVGPNPFNPRTVLSCRLESAADLTLVLYDPQGRRVRTLHSGNVAAGEHRWTWDGRTDDGRNCPTGVYLARLLVEGRELTVRKLALVR